MANRHSDPRLDQVIQYAFEERQWTYERHRSQHMWGTIVCPFEDHTVHIPLKPRSVADAAASIRKLIERCEH